MVVMGCPRSPSGDLRTSPGFFLDVSGLSSGPLGMCPRVLVGCPRMFLGFSQDFPRATLRMPKAFLDGFLV